MKHRIALVLLATLAGCDRPAAPPPLIAVAEPCILPEVLPAAGMQPVRSDEIVADRTILFHMLTLTWMPETCRAGGDGQGDLACHGQTRFGWTLHGLWPNADGKPYPRFCRPAGRVSTATIRATACRTPSVDLIQHEWAAHGTCGWATPEAYFARSTALYDGLKRPDPTLLARGARGPTAGQLRDAFVAANPGLPRGAIYIAVASGNRLREVRICHDLTFQPAACPVGGVGTPDRVVLTVEPVRD